MVGSTLIDMTTRRLTTGPEHRNGGWSDLAANVPGIGASHEAARRLLAGGTGADRNWRLGAEGERIVAALLSELTTARGALRRRPRWRVLHSVPLGRGPTDIDHLLVGPPGVVTINTRHLRGGRLHVDGEHVVVDGISTEHVALSRREAARTAGALGAALRAAGQHALAEGLVVRPVIAVHGGVLDVERWPTGVTLTTSNTLVHALRTMPERIDAAAVDTVYTLARRSTTWREEVLSAR